MATFVGGLAAGVLVVGVLNVTTPDFVAQPGGAVPTSDGGEGGPGGVYVSAEARVNAACLRAFDKAQDISTILAGMDEAVTDVDLQQLDDIVRQLQPIEPRLQQDLLASRVDTSLGTGPGGGGAMTPAVPQPSPSGTR